jgi:uncharacterized membrane protein
VADAVGIGAEPAGQADRAAGASRADRAGLVRLVRDLDAAAVQRRLSALLPHLPVAFLIVVYAVRFSVLTVAVHDGYGTPAFDMSIPDQGIWLMSRFHAPFVTVMGRNLFADHTSFILALLVPLYWIYPHTQALLVLQSCLLASAAIPIYLLGRRLLGRDRLGTILSTALAGAFLLNPALQNGNLEQFHVEAFLVPALALAIYAAVEWRPVLLALSVAACLLCKEDTALLIVPLGVWVLLRRDRKWGAAIIGAAAAWMAFAFKVITPTILGGGSVHTNRVPFGGYGGFFSAIFTKPAKVWDYVTGNGRLFYLWQMGSSLGWVFLIGPSVAAIAVLTFLENVLADFVYQHEIQYHYSMPLVPVLAIGTVWAVSRLRSPQLRVAATGVATSSALVACIFWGLAPFSMNHYPFTSTSSPGVRDADAVIKALPPNAVVSAWYPYVPHIDHRTRVYMFPTPFHAVYWDRYQFEGQRLPFANQVQYLLLPASLDDQDAQVLASISSEYVVVDQVGNVVLYERLSGVLQP